MTHSPHCVRRDMCGVCGGTNTSCEGSPEEASSNQKVVTGVVVGSIIFVLLVVVGVMVYVKRQRQRMGVDVERILQSYMPLEDNNGLRGDSEGGGGGGGGGGRTTKPAGKTK